VAYRLRALKPCSHRPAPVCRVDPDYCYKGEFQCPRCAVDFRAKADSLDALRSLYRYAVEIYRFDSV